MKIKLTNIRIRKWKNLRMIFAYIKEGKMKRKKQERKKERREERRKRGKEKR